MIAVAILVFGYVALFVIVKWIAWHFEDDTDRVKFHSYTERERKKDHGDSHGAWTGPDKK